ncbi:MAG: HD-GYP domain-containing protein [Fimbriimonadaceae bacterium]
MPTRAEVLSALSYALDLVEGQPTGHAARTCLIAMELGKMIGLDRHDMQSLYYAAILKDSGCSNNSARIHKIFGGDELLTKRNVKFIDWSRAVDCLKFGASNTLPDGSAIARFRMMLNNLGPPSKVMNEVTAARCHRGASIASSLGLGRTTAEAIRALDEHWDGRGAPSGLQGDAIPILARVLSLAQTLEVFAWSFGPHQALDVLKKRRGRWFDPEVFTAAIAIESDVAFWARVHASGHAEAAASEPYPDDQPLKPVEMDTICETFASIVDAKSPYTKGHSDRVADIAVGIGRCLGLPNDSLTDLERAGHLHDLGKLAVPNCILDKPARLTDAEFGRVKEHPRRSFEILSPMPGFDRIADIAATHHERLDGRGYWRGLGGEDLSLESRVVTVADVFEALTADRPYRKAMESDAALGILWSEAEAAFDPVCIEALASHIGKAPVKHAA